MGCLEHNPWRRARLQRFVPARRAKTPTITGFQSGKSVPGRRRDQVIAALEAIGKKIRAHLRADDVETPIRRIGAAASVPEKAGNRTFAAWL